MVSISQWACVWCTLTVNSAATNDCRQSHRSWIERGTCKQSPGSCQHLSCRERGVLLAVSLFLSESRTRAMAERPCVADMYMYILSYWQSHGSQSEMSSFQRCRVLQRVRQFHWSRIEKDLEKGVHAGQLTGHRMERGSCRQSQDTGEIQR